MEVINEILQWAVLFWLLYAQINSIRAIKANTESVGTLFNWIKDLTKNP